MTREGSIRVGKLNQVICFAVCLRAFSIPDSSTQTSLPCLTHLCVALHSFIPVRFTSIFEMKDHDANAKAQAHPPASIDDWCERCGDDSSILTDMGKLHYYAIVCFPPTPNARRSLPSAS